MAGNRKPNHAMARDRENELDALEEKMLQACSRAYAAWVDDELSNSRPPSQLIVLLKNTHHAMMQRLKLYLAKKDERELTDEEMLLELSQAMDRVRRNMEKRRKVAEMLS